MLAAVISGLILAAGVGLAGFLLLDRQELDDTACHPAPQRPYGRADAHMIWQIRAGCDSRVCADKAAALDVLIDDGAIVPARTAAR